MKLKFASILSNRFASRMHDLLGRLTSKRMIPLGMAVVAGLFLSGCAVEPGDGYYPYSGAYYGDYGPYDGGEFIVGGYRHGGHYGGHHFYGSSFGHQGSYGGGHGGSFHGGGRGGGGHGGHVSLSLL
jgi:hypothetical protein